MKFRTLVLFFLLTCSLSGCIFSIHGQAITPGETLESWKQNALISWKNDIIKNTFEGRGRYANKWVGCKEGYILSDYEIGFCQGFYLSHSIFRENLYRIAVDAASSHGNREEYVYIETPASNSWDREICNNGSFPGISYEAVEPSISRFLPNNLVLPRPKSTKIWYEGCLEGIGFQKKLLHMFEESKLSKTRITEYKRLVIAADNYVPTEEEEPSYDDSFLTSLREGIQTGNTLYDNCVKDAKILIENGTDPNSNFYAQLGNSLMINIKTGPKKKLCGAAYVDVKDVYNELISTNILGAAVFINER